MFALPYMVILAVYALFLIFFLLVSYANAYHLYSTGTFTRPALLVTSIMCVWCFVIIGLSVIQLARVDLGARFVFFGPAGVVSIEAPTYET